LISYTGPDGRQVRRSAETADFADAKALEQRHRAESHQHAKDRRRGKIGSFDSVLAEYLEPRLSARTRATARNLAAEFSGLHCSEIDKPAVIAYGKKRSTEGAAPATINKELGMLSAAVNAYNEAHGTSLQNHTRSARRREPEGRVRWLEVSEYRRLCAASSGHVRDFIIIACHTDMRRGEILGMTWDRVDFGRRLVTLEARHTKSKRRRSVPLNDAAIEAFRSRKDAVNGSPFVFPGVDYDGNEAAMLDLKKGFHAACRRAGIKDLRPHDLRHTCASWLVMAGVPLYEVRDILWHSTIKLTERYSHLAPENLRAAVQKIDIGNEHATSEMPMRKTA